MDSNTIPEPLCCGTSGAPVVIMAVVVLATVNVPGTTRGVGDHCWACTHLGWMGESTDIAHRAEGKHACDVSNETNAPTCDRCIG